MNREPAVIIGAVVSLVVALGAIFNVVIDADALTSVVVSLAPVVTGLLVRQKVTPVVNAHEHDSPDPVDDPSRTTLGKDVNDF